MLSSTRVDPLKIISFNRVDVKDYVHKIFFYRLRFLFKKRIISLKLTKFSAIVASIHFLGLLVIKKFLILKFPLLIKRVFRSFIFLFFLHHVDLRWKHYWFSDFFLSKLFFHLQMLCKIIQTHILLVFKDFLLILPYRGVCVLWMQLLSTHPYSRYAGWIILENA